MNGVNRSIHGGSTVNHDPHWGPSLHRDRSDYGLAFSPQLSSLRPSQIANHYLISHLPTIPFITAVVGDLRLI
jgi:hypothetical protein